MQRRRFLTGIAAGAALTIIPASAQTPTARPALLLDRGVVYGEADGQELLLDVARLPDRESPDPAMIVIHGGFLAVGSRADIGSIARPLAVAGYVTFNIDYRLFSEETGSNLWPAQLDDAQRAVRWVRAHSAEYGVDPDRIGAIGHSAGGQLASFLGTRDTRDTSDRTLVDYSSRVQCVVDIAGDVDFSIPFVYENIDALMAAILGGSREQPPAEDAYRDFSAITFVDDTSAPFLVLHGARDDLVPVAHSRRLVEKLHGAGVEVVYAEFPDIDHFGVAQWDLVGSQVLAFLDRHLTPGR